MEVCKLLFESLGVLRVAATGTADVINASGDTFSISVPAMAARSATVTGNSDAIAVVAGDTLTVNGDSVSGSGATSLLRDPALQGPPLRRP